MEPENASLERCDFLWRLSSAEIANAGPFSSFPDFDRLLMLLTGEEGLILKFSETRKHLMPGTVLHFRGEEPVQAEIEQGPVRDLGLIYDRKRVLAKMSLFDFEKKPRSFSLTAPDVLLFVLTGEIHAIVYPGEKDFLLEPFDTLRIGASEKERLVFLDPGDARARIAAVEIAPISC